eukprot:TRINITY_DN4914_c0_g1_i2.p1 TRINITY_DN4914_c0_g1~~TRINITY_DN4914_c0_g1_i2.p1  ORF type:complete len:135 (-),score=59.11 TRINITY_DN4914_c0_g1_i2:265-669(-)
MKDEGDHMKEELEHMEKEAELKHKEWEEKMQELEQGLVMKDQEHGKELELLRMEFRKNSAMSSMKEQKEKEKYEDMRTQYEKLYQVSIDLRKEGDGLRQQVSDLEKAAKKTESKLNKATKDVAKEKKTAEKGRI